MSVNKQLLDAAKRALNYAQNVDTANGVYFDDDNDIPVIEQAVAAAEQVQQAEPVARDVLMAALDDLDNAVVENHGIGMPYKLRQEIADRYASQLPAVAVPDGYALVPVVASDHMTWVGQSMRHDREISIGSIWAAMLAAAQKGGA